MFYTDVAKVDRDIAYVAMVVHVCCKLLFPMFHLFFQSTLQVCLLVCCICFTHMLQVFYLDVAYVLQWFLSVFHMFLQVFQMHVSCVSSAIRRILQVLHPDVLKVDRVLHLSPYFCCLASVSPPPTSVGWAFELEAQAGAAPSPSSRCQ